jgi:hypothetical protein
VFCGLVRKNECPNWCRDGHSNAAACDETGSSAQRQGDSQAWDRSTSICEATNTSKLTTSSQPLFPLKMSGAGYDVVVDVDEEVNQLNQGHARHELN